jgi:hypothetical protein
LGVHECRLGIGGRKRALQLQSGAAKLLWDEKPNLVPLRDTKAFISGIASLPPGKRFRAFFDVLFARNRDALPDVYEVSITYDAPALGERNLEHTTTLDLGIYWNLLIAERKRRQS